MSQLGRCKCGEQLVKTMARLDGKPVEVEMCPKCDELKGEPLSKKLDKFGLEELKK